MKVVTTLAMAIVVVAVVFGDGQPRRRGNKTRVNFIVYSEKDYGGYSLPLEVGPNQCIPIPNVWNDKISSINIGEGCVNAYQHGGCRGHQERISPGTKGHDDLKNIGLNNVISAFGSC